VTWGQTDAGKSRIHHSSAFFRCGTSPLGQRKVVLQHIEVAVAVADQVDTGNMGVQVTEQFRSWHAGLVTGGWKRPVPH